MANNNKFKKNFGNKDKSYKANKGRSAESSMNYGIKLPFSDNPTLLTIANMSEGKIGFDISVNGFTSTMGNRTMALISIPQTPHNINITPGLPVYMGAKAVSEVEYPTTDSDLTPSSIGVVNVNNLAIGRLNTLGYYESLVSYSYQNMAMILAQSGLSSTKTTLHVLGLAGTSVTGRSE
jgi:hypothetical protein